MCARVAVPAAAALAAMRPVTLIAALAGVPARSVIEIASLAAPAAAIIAARAVVILRGEASPLIALLIPSAGAGTMLRTAGPRPLAAQAKRTDAGRTLGELVLVLHQPWTGDPG